MTRSWRTPLKIGIASPLLEDFRKSSNFFGHFSNVVGKFSNVFKRVRTLLIVGLGLGNILRDSINRPPRPMSTTTNKLPMRSFASTGEGDCKCEPMERWSAWALERSGVRALEHLGAPPLERSSSSARALEHARARALERSSAQALGVTNCQCCPDLQQVRAIANANLFVAPSHCCSNTATSQMHFQRFGFPKLPQVNPDWW